MFHAVGVVMDVAEGLGQTDSGYAFIDQAAVYTSFALHFCSYYVCERCFKSAAVYV